MQGDINPENPPAGRGGRVSLSVQDPSRYSAGAESDLSTAGYTLSGANDRQQQQNLTQLSRELSPGK